MRVAFLTLAALAVSACSPPISRPDPTNGPTVPTGSPLWPAGALQVGASDGVGGFTPFASSVQVVAGPQGGGGRHVFLSFRIVGQTPPAEPYILARANRASDGKFVGSAEQPMAFDPADGGSTDGTYSFRLPLCPTPAGVNIVDQDLTIEAYAFSRQGGTFLAKASATVKAQCSNCQPECGG